MSRVGLKPIPIPSGVTVTLAPGSATVKGPKGELSQHISASLTAVSGVVLQASHNRAKAANSNRLRFRGPSPRRRSFSEREFDMLSSPPSPSLSGTSWILLPGSC